MAMLRFSLPSASKRCIASRRGNFVVSREHVLHLMAIHRQRKQRSHAEGRQTDIGKLGKFANSSPFLGITAITERSRHQPVLACRSYGPQLTLDEVALRLNLEYCLGLKLVRAYATLGANIRHAI